MMIMIIINNNRHDHDKTFFHQTDTNRADDRNVSDEDMPPMVALADTKAMADTTAMADTEVMAYTQAMVDAEAMADPAMADPVDMEAVANTLLYQQISIAT